MYRYILAGAHEPPKVLPSAAHEVLTEVYELLCNKCTLFYKTATCDITQTSSHTSYYQQSFFPQMEQFTIFSD